MSENHPRDRRRRPRREEDRRRNDGGNNWAWLRERENWYRDVWLFVISLVVLAAVGTTAYSVKQSHEASVDARKISVSNRDFIHGVEAEARARRDESCRYFEQQEAAAYRRVTSSYAYVEKLSRSQAHSLINRTIISSLTDAYAQALAAKAPGYCDAPGIGLPEPGPKLPPRRDFSFLLP